MLLCAGKLNTNSAKRAAQVRKAIEKLGPAYVKVAQAISTRGDILDMNYLREIERLQDRVPPFPTKAALLVMTQGKQQALPAPNHHQMLKLQSVLCGIVA